MSVQPAENPTTVASAPHALTATPAAHPLPVAAFTEHTDADFFRAMGEINQIAAAAEKAHLIAQQNLATMLTEQVTRHVLKTYPQAALLFVRAVADFHTGPDGERSPDCEGHHQRLAPHEVADAHGVAIDGFDANSPLHYLMERLTPLIGTQDQVLDIDNRQWAYDCSAL